MVFKINYKLDKTGKKYTVCIYIYIHHEVHVLGICF